MRPTLKSLLSGLLCLTLLLASGCTQQNHVPSSTISPAPTHSAANEPEATAPSGKPAETSRPSSDPGSDKTVVQSTPSATSSIPRSDEETELAYTLDGISATTPAVLHHAQNGYSIVYDAMYYECRSQFELDSYWSDTGIYLSVGLAYNMPLDYVLDGLQLQENIEMGAQPVYIGRGLYPAYTVYRTTEDGLFLQFWVLECGADTMLIERAYPTDHEYAGFHRAVQDAMLSTLTLDGDTVTLPNGIKAAYTAVLEDLLYRHRLPDCQSIVYDSSFGDISENRFAVCDVDNDGSPELILEFTTAPSVGMSFLIYGYDEEADTLHLQLEEFPNAQLFSNGVIEAGASHNHSYSGVFWPYTLYQYDAEQDCYTMVGSVSGWDKLTCAEDFPDHIDEDGDGLVYYIDAEGYAPETPVDGGAYFVWRSFYMNRAESLQIPYLPLTEECIASLRS